MIIEAFVQSLQKRYRSPHTIKCYKSDLEDFERFCQQQGINHPICAMLGATPDLVKMFIERPEFKESTQARKLASIRTFYRWATVEYQTPNPTVTVKTPRFTPANRSCLADNAVDKLFENIKGDNELLTARDRAICSLIVHSGLRVNELESLNMEDSDIENAKVKVSTFGKTARWMDIPHSAQYLSAYLQVRGPACANDPLFVNKTGGRLNPRSIRRKVAKYSDLAGINASPRNLRHTFVKRHLDAGTDLTALTQHLGQQINPVNVYQQEHETETETCVEMELVTC